MNPKETRDAIEMSFVWGESRARDLRAGETRVPKLAELTTLEVGGRPRFYARVEREEDARAVSRWARESTLPLWVIGGGSNVVCADDSLEGVTLQLAFTEILWGSGADSGAGSDADPSASPSTSSTRVEVTAGAGVVWDDLVRAAVERDLAGIECLSGIPGWVGAAPLQNIGAYGQELSDTCIAVRVYDRERDETRWWSASECDLRYRQSIFKAHPERYIIFAVRLALHVGGAPTIRYQQLAHHLESRSTERRESTHSPLYTLKLVSSAVRDLRATKSMVWRPDDPNRRSVGSFFTNPILSASAVTRLRERAQELGFGAPPLWVLNEQTHEASSLINAPDDSSESSSKREGLSEVKVKMKTAAAWLIEHAGLKRGAGRGAVGLSSAHTLAIINRGGASADEVWAWARVVQRAVWRVWNVWLEPEARSISSAPTSLELARPRVALVSCRDLPEWEVDDHPLWSALKARGIELAHPTWDDPDFDWARCDLVIPRTTWDYQTRWPEFLAWLKRVSRVSVLLNPLSLIEWNLDKRYLRDLRAPQPPTEWLTQRPVDSDEAARILADRVRTLCDGHGWRRAFLKPNIAASAVGTLRFDLSSDADQAQLVAHLRQWLPERTLILQPYLDQVERRGELSLIYFDGKYSHAVRKVPVAGDYRVQDDYGASDESWEPPLSWRTGCDALVNELSPLPLYARCDFLTGPEGEPWLIELELIEPSLFFRHDARSAERFADAIVSRCPPI